MLSAAAAAKLGSACVVVLVSLGCAASQSTGSTITVPRTPISFDDAATAPASVSPRATVTSPLELGDIEECELLAAAIGRFAVLGPRQWISEDGIRIVVDLPGWYSRAATLADSVTASVGVITDDELRVLAVEFAEPLQDYFTEEWNHSDPDVFRQAVLRAVRTADERSRRLERRCASAGVGVDFVHPLTSTGGGGHGDG